MIDGEKIFKALKSGKVTGLGCTLTSAECDYLIAHDDALTQYIILLENDQLMKQRIAELEARIAELEARQRWIPVSERLPDNWEFVLTFDMSQSTRVPVTAFYNPETSLWATHFSCGLWVTHWMPLPESPIVYGKVCEE